MNSKDTIRLLHKFYPKSITFVQSLKSLTFDSISQTIKSSDNDAHPSRFDINKLSDDLLLQFYPDFEEIEKGRVLVIPDTGASTPPPFVCHAKSLMERVKEMDKQYGLCNGTDTLFCFESTGKILFFDHNENCTVGSGSTGVKT